MLSILALCVLLFAEHFTGQIFHAVLGLILTVIVGIHTRRHIVQMKYRTKAIHLIDQGLILVLVILLLTGILAHPMHDLLAIKILHKLCAVILVLGIITHILQHLRNLPSTTSS